MISVPNKYASSSFSILPYIAFFIYIYFFVRILFINLLFIFYFTIKHFWGWCSINVILSVVRMIPDALICVWTLTDT
jgi:hypothetical protein